MAYTAGDDGRYSIPLVDFGRRLRDNFGLKIVEHPEFGGVTDVHAPNSYHKYGEAIDIQDWRDDVIDGVGWKDRTSNLRDMLRGMGPEVIGPGDMEGHGSHVHLAATGGMLSLSPDQYNYFFGGEAGGKSSVFNGASGSSYTPPATPQKPTDSQVEAKERATNYAKMSKAELDTAYDAMRSDPAKARVEGMKMHKAFFNKP